MAQVATACGVSKATLHHCVRDKQDLLCQITSTHVQRLQTLVQTVADQGLLPQEHLEQLVLRFIQVYEHEQAEHRVLTEDVKFLPEHAFTGSDRRAATNPRQQVLQGQRMVVQAVADALAALRPDLRSAALHKPVAMLLFGMMNWIFTWLRAEGRLSHQAVAQLLLGLLMGGIHAVQLPQPAARQHKTA